MKRYLRPLLAASLAAALALCAPVVFGQASVPISAAEGGTLWFVELAGAPVADGNTHAAVRNEKAAFRNAAALAGLRYGERRSFDVLFNGFSVSIDPADRAKLSMLPGVKAVYPVEIIQAPIPEVLGDGSAADLVTAITMTGASIAQNSLGLTGQGVKVGIIDTGIDIDHPAFGGSGINGATPFPTARVIAGYDFVGDQYDAGGTGASLVPVPDGNPDDCNGHGTHVSGIVGGNGGGIKGVAPGVSIGMYRVFGCTGSTSSDIIVAALERAYADGMQVINQSLGSSRQWPQYPTAAASSRLVNKGVVMVASIGNSGPGGSPADALFAAGAPGTGDKVIGVASFDNLASTQLAFSVSPDAKLVGYTRATGAPPSPTSGSLPMAKTGTPTTVNDGCSALPAGSLAGSAVLIRRGTCGFFVKASNAQNAGAAAVVLYNNVAGSVSPTVAGSPAITIPVVMVSAADGATLNGRIAAGATTLTWTAQTVQSPLATAGLISSFSSFGLAADLSLKPNIGAPGGVIFSSYPLELGAYATLSGTSMSSPHVAGGVALVLEAKPNLPAGTMRDRLQNSADPKNWSLNAGLGLLDSVHRQGAGMLDIIGTIQATTVVQPAQVSLGESEAGPKTVTLTIKNEAAGSVTYDLGHTSSIATGPNSQSGAAYSITGFFASDSTVAFSAPSVTVPGGASATVDATITANASLPERSLYGGYIVLTPQGGGATYRVPFAGFKGDYQSTVVLTPTASGFPWLAKLSGANFLNQPAGASYSLAGSDVAYFLLHLDHLSRRVRIEAFDAVSGKAWHRVSDDQYVTRNSTPTGFFAFTWDGNTFAGKGKNDNQQYTVPNGRYVVKVSVLKALGDESNPAHWETWTSPVVTIARP